MGGEYLGHRGLVGFPEWISRIIEESERLPDE